MRKVRGVVEKKCVERNDTDGWKCEYITENFRHSTCRKERQKEINITNLF